MNFVYLNRIKFKNCYVFTNFPDVIKTDGAFNINTKHDKCLKSVEYLHEHKRECKVVKKRGHA
jgi:hypothetical protein